MLTSINNVLKQFVHVWRRNRYVFLPVLCSISWNKTAPVMVTFGSSSLKYTLPSWSHRIPSMSFFPWILGLAVDVEARPGGHNDDFFFFWGGLIVVNPFFITSDCAIQKNHFFYTWKIINSRTILQNLLLYYRRCLIWNLITTRYNEPSLRISVEYLCVSINWYRIPFHYVNNVLKINIWL